MPSPDPPEPAPKPAAAPSDGVRYRTRHTTRYDYGDRVSISHHLIHLQARPVARQTCTGSRLTIAPVPAARNDWIDYFGNPTTYFSIQKPHRELVVTAEMTLSVRPPASIDLDATPEWEMVRDAAAVPRGAPAFEANRVLYDSLLVRGSAEITEYAAPSFEPKAPVGLCALDLMQRIHREFIFDPTATTVATPLADVLRWRRGVCQDFAHLGVACLRALGLPARYVSGYLRTHPPPGRARLVGADVSHAWFSVWCGEAGWLDLDPTNDRAADADYITLAWGRDYDDVSPVRGVLLGGYGHTLTVEVDVEPVES